MKSRVLIFGVSGLLGSNLANQLLRDGFEVIGTSRTPKPFPINGVKVIPFQVGDSIEHLLDLVEPNFVVNCVVHKDFRNIKQLKQGLEINSHFPKRLSRVLMKRRIWLIHISSNAVFFGRRGHYYESDLKSSRSLYGLSKILGETNPNFTTVLRTSFIGKTISSNLTENGIIERILRAPLGSFLTFSNSQFWNGITTVALSDFCSRLLQGNRPYLGEFHLYSSESLSRYNLVKLLTNRLSREDLTILPVKEKKLDLTLSSQNKMWIDYCYSRYHTPTPSIIQLLNSEIPT